MIRIVKGCFLVLRDCDEEEEDYTGRNEDYVKDEAMFTVILQQQQ